MNIKFLSLILVVFLIFGSTVVESQRPLGLRRRWRWRRRWVQPWCPYWDWRCREFFFSEFN